MKTTQFVGGALAISACSSGSLLVGLSDVAADALGGLAAWILVVIF